MSLVGVGVLRVLSMRRRTERFSCPSGASGSHGFVRNRSQPACSARSRSAGHAYAVSTTIGIAFVPSWLFQSCNEFDAVYAPGEQRFCHDHVSVRGDGQSLTRGLDRNGQKPVAAEKLGVRSSAVLVNLNQ